MRVVASTILIVLSMMFVSDLAAQGDNWYVLKSVVPIQEEQTKSMISTVMEYLPEATIWFNGTKSSTFGCRTQDGVDWSEILEPLQNSSIFLADVSEGELHFTGNRANTSIYYQRALFYGIFPEQQPEDFTAKLNQDEWDALPIEVRGFYQEYGNYVVAGE